MTGTTDVRVDGVSDRQHTIGQGDRRPYLRRVLTLDGEPFDLSDATTVNFKMYEEDTDEHVVEEGRVNVVDAESGQVQYEWRENDTDKPGTFRAAFVVKFSQNEEMHFPNIKHMKIKVTNQ